MASLPVRVNWIGFYSKVGTRTLVLEGHCTEWLINNKLMFLQPETVHCCIFYGDIFCRGRPFRSRIRIIRVGFYGSDFQMIWEEIFFRRVLERLRLDAGLCPGADPGPGNTEFLFDSNMQVSAGHSHGRWISTLLVASDPAGMVSLWGCSIIGGKLWPQLSKVAICQGFFVLQPLSSHLPRVNYRSSLFRRLILPLVASGVREHKLKKKQSC